MSPLPPRVAPRPHPARDPIGGPRISELERLSWADVIQREDKVQLSVLGKRGKVSNGSEQLTRIGVEELTTL